MKHQIHINDQGELLLRMEGQPDVRFRDQQATANIIYYGKPDSFAPACFKVFKGKSFAVPNSYTAEVKWYNPCIEHKKCLIADEKNHNNCAQLHGNVCQKLHQVAVLTQLKQAEKPISGSEWPKDEGIIQTPFCVTGEPGNEAKKEEQLFTKEDLRTAFEAGESHYDFENWFIEKFD